MVHIKSQPRQTVKYAVPPGGKGHNYCWGLSTDLLHTLPSTNCLTNEDPQYAVTWEV